MYPPLLLALGFLSLCPSTVIIWGDWPVLPLVLTTIKNCRNQSWQRFRSLAVRQPPTGSLLPCLPWCSVGPESALTVPLCTQLPGNSGGEIKLSLEQFYWDFVPERNGINNHQEKQLLKLCAPEQARRQMLGNLYPALIKWPPGHTPLRFVVAGNDTRVCVALYWDNSGQVVSAASPPSALPFSAPLMQSQGEVLVNEIISVHVLSSCNLIS